MTYAHYIKEIGRGAQGARSLSGDDARQLYAAILDGGVPDLELGAILLALRVKGESLDEMLGFLAAAEDRTALLDNPAGRVRPVVLPSYNGARKEANLTPLLALMLRRFGVPVLVHGLLEGFGRVTTGHIFRELGIMPATTTHQAQTTLQEKGLAFVPLTALAPGLHNLLALRARMGVRNSAHSLVKMLNPFEGEAVVVAPATHPDFIDLMRDMLLARGERAILLRGTEGEPFANPKRRPRLEYVHEGFADVLFEAEHDSLRTLPNLPDGADAAQTAKWTQRVLDKQAALPKPIANQLACLLYASGYAEDFNQAKAIVAVEANALAATSS
ncbi:DNA-binding protein YbiB [Quatrionicoccus australiensis]|uniref:DNA-binding protein YbiB n=1 Tax=Quatrionicoccus australiensis TaxID=138118 RepID=UPI001CF87EEC|nr:DNA-binding protein YbiB [Quatrionicoccus australiensis]UCV14461.1 DNA-binding protein YbiB [Quatrionicoccus australiensis]